MDFFQCRALRSCPGAGLSKLLWWVRLLLGHGFEQASSERQVTLWLWLEQASWNPEPLGVPGTQREFRGGQGRVRSQRRGP